MLAHTGPCAKENRPGDTARRRLASWLVATTVSIVSSQVSATGVTWVTPPPSSITSGQPFAVSWDVSGATSFDASVQWDPTDPGSPGNPDGNIDVGTCVPSSTSCSTEQVPRKTADSLTAPVVSPTGFPVDVKYVVHTRAPAGGTTNAFSDVRKVRVFPDCATSGDGAPCAPNALCVAHVCSYSPAGDFSPKQFTYNSIPAQSPTATNLVLITHGYHSDASGWVADMADAISNALTAAGRRAEWDVVTYDWKQDASDADPNFVLGNGLLQGRGLGTILVRGGYHYDHVHLIGHSAGSALINAAAGALLDDARATRRALSIHTTFLDPYAPPGVVYGQYSTFADEYFNTSDYVWTNSALGDAFSADVTALNPAPGGLELLCIDLTDDDFMSTCQSRHAWPHEWYARTIADPTLAEAKGLGFQLSREYSETGTAPTYDADHRRGDSVVLGTAESRTHIVPPAVMLLPAVDFSTVPTIFAPTGTVTVDGTSLSLFTGSPVWMTALVEAADVVNVLRFDYQFLSSADGLLTVFFDDRLVFEADERTSSGGVDSSPVVWLGRDAPRGPHRLSVHLEKFGNRQSVVRVSNLRLGLVEEAVPSTTTTVPVSSPSSNSTSTTLPLAEVCGNCLDDDGNGMFDYEDGACCSSTTDLRLRGGTLRPARKVSGAARFHFKGTVFSPGPTVDPRVDNVTLQLGTGGGRPFCLSLAPASWRKKRRTFRIDQSGGTSGVSESTLRIGRHALAFSVRGQGSIPLRDGPMHVTVRIGGLCATASVPVRRTAKGLIF